MCVSPLYTEYTFYFALYKSLVFFHFIVIFSIFLYIFFTDLFLFCVVSYCQCGCGEVWTLGVWGELACHKRLFNPLPQFLRLGTWCPAFVCVCVCTMCVCVCVCVCVCACVCVFCGLSSFFVLGWRVCVWWFGGGWGVSGFFLCI